jgi:ribosomal protein S18 acetylase RimI-like enzyme
MPVIRASLEHLVEVRSLLRQGRRVYSDFGLEDLADRLARGPAVVGVADGKVWGVACAQIEERPSTMPRSAPTRVHLRCIAVRVAASGPVGFLPNPDASVPSCGDATELLLALVAQIAQTRTTPMQLLTYGAQDWLVHALTEGGFDLLDTVEFFELDRLSVHLAQRPPVPPFLHLQLAEPHILPELAELDAVTFPPLWHFGERELVELCLRGRVQVAYVLPDSPNQEQSIQGLILAGYAAVSYNSREEAQLARLAVVPHYQGRGIGRTLLWDAVADAAAAKRRTLVLNTQRDNHRSRRLYLGMGFHPIGEALPVFGRLIAD